MAYFLQFVGESVKLLALDEQIAGYNNMGGNCRVVSGSTGAVCPDILVVKITIYMPLLLYLPMMSCYYI